MKKIVLLLMLFCVTINYVYAESYNYDDIKQKNETKLILINCDFTNILLSQGSYCVQGKNRDYISHAASFGLHQSNDFLHYLVSLSHYLKKESLFLEYKKLELFSSDNNIESFIKNVEISAPTSSVISNQHKTLIYLSYSDLLLRNVVYPSYRLLDIVPSLATLQNNQIETYKIKYSIPPITFISDYSQGNKSRYLGVVPYLIAKQALANEPSNFQSYLDIYKMYYSQLNATRSTNYNANSITAFDYVYPYISEKKFEDIRFARVNNPLYKKYIPSVNSYYKGGQYGYLPDFLPPYVLGGIQVLGGETKDKMLYDLDREDLDKVVYKTLNTNAGAVIIVDNKKFERIPLTIRYHYFLAPPSQGRDLDSKLSQELSLPYIFNNIANHEVVDITVSNPTDIRNLPKSCFLKVNANYLERLGYKSAKVQEFINGRPSGECSPNQLQMVDILFSDTESIEHFYSGTTLFN